MEAEAAVSVDPLYGNDEDDGFTCEMDPSSLQNNERKALNSWRFIRPGALRPLLVVFEVLVLGMVNLLQVDLLHQLVRAISQNPLIYDPQTCHQLRQA